MKFGVCGGTDMARQAVRTGFDYVEGSVGGLLTPLQPAQAFQDALAAMRETGVPCPVLNCFVPGDMKITGPDTNLSRLIDYGCTVFERAENAAVDTIVFGSGGARRVPEGFSQDAARDQLLAFCAAIAPHAMAHGVTVVVEPLNRAECNILTTVAETAALVREVDHPAIRLLVDAYHLLHDDDACVDIVTHGDILEHVHVATVPGRLAPGLEPSDFAPFFGALAQGGYAGRVSIEGKIPRPETDLPVALDLLRTLSL